MRRPLRRPGGDRPPVIVVDRNTMTRVTGTFDFDPYDAAFLDDPYPVYTVMRSHHPATYQPSWDLTFFSRHADVAAILKDRRFGRQASHVLAPATLSRPEMPEQYPMWCKYIRGSFIDLEPPRHTRLRRLVAKAFTRRSAESYRARLVGVAHDALDEALDAGGMEAIAGYGTPIPLTMISELMGIPEAERSQLLAWSHAIVRLFDYNATPDEGAAAEAAVIEFAAYVRELLAQRRRTPGPDLISDLATVEEGGGRLSEDDLVATAILTLNAGHEATVQAIGNGLLALGTHPDQFAALRENHEILPDAVEELLRYDTPLQMFERWVLEDVEWNGTRLRSGTKVGLLFGSANRDGAVFEDPDELDLRRTDNRHVSFGAGVHHCIGAPLARVELQAAFGVFAQRVKTLEVLTDNPERHASMVFRGLRTLPVGLS